MGKKVLWSFVLVLSMLVGNVTPGATAGKEESLVNGIDANFPPFAYVDKSGKPDGFDVAVVDWIAKEMGFKVKHQPMDWDGIIPSLKAKKIDMIASGMSITEARKKEVNFTTPYWIINNVLVVKNDSPLTAETTLSEGKKIGVQRGTSEAKWMEENLVKEQGKKLELVYYDSAPLAVEDLINGRIDAAAMNEPPAEDAAKKKPVKILGGFGMPSEEFGYAVRKEDAELLNKLNEGLKKIMAGPAWEELKVKYDLK
jgi:polar amino acid transport system substrate-binding protein